RIEMSALTPASLMIGSSNLCSVSFSVSVQVNKTAKPGDTVTLPCRAPSSTNIIVVEWSRPELETEYVFMFRDGRSVPEHQHPSFQNRVVLKDRPMKDGDVSIILKNVTSNDTGTYECRVFQRRTNRRKRANLKTERISTIYLDIM
uniref:Ig-like domain-containing protein n=1 Tax=Seriola lalandi dorsalis TaxID=1841481 RepID=A0A3B4X0I4_SERLL